VIRLKILILASALALGACHQESGSPYRSQGNPKGQNPEGTPADRTGGARNVPDNAGGGPGVNTRPADR
jgi:hypothetical protein